jgi:hypothetical protein
MLKTLKAEGVIVYAAKHDRKFVGENWADKTPMSMTLGYLVVVPATKKLEHLYVPRKTKLF